MWTRSAPTIVAAGLLAGSVLTGCGLSADAGTTASAEPAAVQSLPGSDASTARLGIITERFMAQTGDLPGSFGGFNAEQISALTQSLTRVEDRSITVLSTPITLGGSVADRPTRDAAMACTEHRGSSIVITDVADPALIDCLIGNGSIVIDASAQPWDEAALIQRAPFLWATATATADVAELALLAQAKAAGLLATGPATIVAGPDQVTQRVAATITSPGLTADGLVPATITVGEQVTASPTTMQARDAKQFSAAVDQARRDGQTGVVRPIAPRVFSAMTSSDSFNRVRSTILITSTSWPGGPLARGTLSSGTAPIGSRTALLGWSPPSDGTAMVDTPNAAGDAAAAAACQTTLKTNLPPPGRQGAWASLYRMCDALSLARTALSAQGTPTAADVRDTIWNASTQWQPAAVTANGWTPNTYTGANIAQWFTWNPSCTLMTKQDPIGCFAPTGAPIPLQPRG